MVRVHNIYDMYNEDYNSNIFTAKYIYIFIMETSTLTFIVFRALYLRKKYVRESRLNTIVFVVSAVLRTVCVALVFAFATLGGTFDNAFYMLTDQCSESILLLMISFDEAIFQRFKRRMSMENSAVRGARNSTHNSNRNSTASNKRNSRIVTTVDKSNRAFLG
jgi:hypothetical protein